MVCPRSHSAWSQHLPWLLEAKALFRVSLQTRRCKDGSSVNGAHGSANLEDYLPSPGSKTIQSHSKSSKTKGSLQRLKQFSLPKVHIISGSTQTCQIGGCTGPSAWPTAWPGAIPTPGAWQTPWSPCWSWKIMINRLTIKVGSMMSQIKQSAWWI